MPTPTTEQKLEQAQAGLLEILEVMKKDGAYSDYDHIGDVLKEAGVSFQETVTYRG